MSGITYIGNEAFQIGMDMDSGGAIVHVSCHGSANPPVDYKDRNLLNVHDKGRMLQQSFYGSEDGSKWMDRPWSWNPVQGGSFDNQRPTLKAAFKEGLTCLSATTIPRHWATGQQIDEVEMNQKACVNKDHVQVHYTMKYTGSTNHASKNQEKPALFVLRKFSQLHFYKGDKPWTNDALTNIAPPPETNPMGNQEINNLSESWAAYIDPNTNWGIGMYFPHTTRIVYYVFEGGGDHMDPKASACSYFSPIVTDTITPNKTYSYNVYITTGNVEQIRATFSKIKDTPR